MKRNSIVAASVLLATSASVIGTPIATASVSALGDVALLDFVENSTTEALNENNIQLGPTGSSILISYYAGDVPKCTTARIELGFVQIYNYCKNPQGMRLKAVVANGRDSSCVSVAPGSRVNSGPVGLLSRIDRVVRC